MRGSNRRQYFTESELGKLTGMLVQGMRAIWHPWFAIASVTQDDHASGILGHLGVQYPCHRASWAMLPRFNEASPGSLVSRQ
jgi:hypothetical protein